MKSALLAVLVLTVAGTALHFAGTASKSGHSAKAGAQQPSVAAHKPLARTAASIPLFFEPNQGQTDSQVKFLARGSGYGLFLTSDEAVLSLQHRAAKGRSATGNVIRMRLDGAGSTASIQGEQPLPGISNYFIGNDPSKWHRGIPQFGSVEYQSVYPGINLIYYGNEGQLEYDFRVAPGADPDQIALNFEGASAHLDSGDLVLSTAGGDVRFHAPHIYQPAGQQGSPESVIPGRFRQLADNKIGFALGRYDRTRELVIDPALNYSTYLGAGGEVCPALANEQPPVPGQGCPQVAVDSSGNIYVAGSTSSANFPLTAGAIQTTLAGAQNLYIAEINPSLVGTSQLVFATYLGGNGIDSLAGIAVDPGNFAAPNINVYVAGTTTSTNFPVSTGQYLPFESSASFTVPGQTHGFLSVINIAEPAGSTAITYTLNYSTYIAGSSTGGSDVVTGVAVDSAHNAYLTGTTTSTNSAIDSATGFPATTNAYQLCPFGPIANNACPTQTSGPPQFFASQIFTQGSGPQSMLYSTYFGGGYPSNAIVTGGGVAVDTAGNMYFTGTTNMPSVASVNGQAGFPVNANGWQTCLNQPGTSTCSQTPSTNTDAILVKFTNPSQSPANSAPAFATYLGGSSNDTGIAVALDPIENAYLTGSTNSGDWNCTSPCNYGPAPFNAQLVSGATNAYVAKIGVEEGTVFPLLFFGYVGGTGPDIGMAIAADANEAAHISGLTTSSNLPILDPLVILPSNPANPVTTIGNVYGGSGDAFIASVSTSLIANNAGDYITYLGGSALDQGTGIALDQVGNAYVAGITASGNFPLNPNVTPLQGQLVGAQNAFVTEIGAYSQVALTAAAPSPAIVNAGTPVNFTFNLANNGPDPATTMTFQAIVPGSGLTTPATATINSGEGTCTPVSQVGNQGVITCTITSTLAVSSQAQVVVSLTPTIPPPSPPQVTVAGKLSVNGGAFGALVTATAAQITNFTVSATTPTSSIDAGQTAIINVTLTPGTLGYTAGVTMTQSSKPSMVTATTPVFNVTPVYLSGTASAQTQLTIQTVARPVSSGSLLRQAPFYATWLPIGGLSLAGLGVGAERRRRRWVVGAFLGLVAGLILLLPSCGSSSSPAAINGGTAPGTYQITITGSAGNGAANLTTINLTVN